MRSHETIIELDADPGPEFDSAEPVDPTGRLLFLGEIARGGVGVVHWSRDTILGRDLALKVLQEKHRDRPTMLERFVQEARIAGQLQHPGIVPVHELGSLGDGRPYFTMKLVKGRTLAEILAERSDPQTDRPHLLGIFLQVAQTIAYAHERGVIHRDLKPSNIMVGKYGEVQIMDWGLAKVLPRAATSLAATLGTGAGASVDEPCDQSLQDAPFMGTPDYMAPEQFGTDGGQVDERTDVFALGVILCEILTARRVYEGYTPQEIRTCASEAKTGPAIATLNACGAHEELLALARDALAPNRHGRPRNAGAVAGRLSAHLEGMQERLRQADLARAEAQARASEERKRRRLAAPLAFCAVALVALASASYVSWIQRRESREAAAASVLREVEVLHHEASSDPTGDSRKWRTASDALRRASVMLADVPTVTRNRLTDLTTTVVSGLRRAEADQILLDRLELARYRADEGDHAIADSLFGEAFRAAGMDVAKSEPAVMGKMIAPRPIDVRNALIAALDCWSIVRRGRDENEADTAWRTPLAAARAADPDPWRNGLRDAFESKDRAALARLARTEELANRPAPSLWLMGRLLIWSGQIEQADEFLTRAWHAYPQDFWINLDLSLALLQEPWRRELALNYATSAVTLRPESAVAHLRLGWIHQVFANKVDAEAEYRRALRLWPDYGRAHARLAGLLFFRSRRAESADEYRKAIALMPDEAEPLWVGLGDSLMRLHKLKEAEVALEDASRRYPSSFPLWLQVTRLRLAQRDASKAEEALRRAEVLAKPETNASAEVAYERMRLKLLPRLPGFLSRQDRPHDNTERWELAKLCGEAGLAATGARFYAESIAAEPTSVEDRVLRPRCYGAFLAAWAGCEKTLDDPAPDAEERARLRRQALEWLRGEMVTWIPMLEGGRTGNRRDAAAALRGWMNTHELAGVRDGKALEALPEDERTAWRALWDEAATRVVVDPG
jgi:serine/threonine-protein kinase